jgi:hypothetical protein
MDQRHGHHLAISNQPHLHPQDSRAAAIAYGTAITSIIFVFIQTVLSMQIRTISSTSTSMAISQHEQSYITVTRRQRLQGSPVPRCHRKPSHNPSQLKNLTNLTNLTVPTVVLQKQKPSCSTFVSDSYSSDLLVTQWFLYSAQNPMVVKSSPSRWRTLNPSFNARGMYVGHRCVLRDGVDVDTPRCLLHTMTAHRLLRLSPGVCSVDVRQCRVRTP